MTTARRRRIRGWRCPECGFTTDRDFEGEPIHADCPKAFWPVMKRTYLRFGLVERRIRPEFGGILRDHG